LLQFLENRNASEVHFQHAIAAEDAGE